MQRPLVPWSPILGAWSVGIALLFAAPASGQTWTGAASGSWNTANNWTPAGVPASGATTALTFTGTSPNLATTQNIGPSFTLNVLTFSSTAAAYSIANNALVFDGSSPSLVQNAASNIAITSTVHFNASGSIGGTGTGGLTLAGLDVDNGTLTLGRNVTVGALQLGVAGSTPSAAGTAVTVNTGTNTLTLNGDITFVSTTQVGFPPPPATINGRIDLGGATRTITGTFSSSLNPPFIDLTINAVISGNGGLIKQGGNGDPMQGRPRVLLTAQNTYTGPTVLQVNSDRLYLGIVNALPTTTVVTVSPGSQLVLSDNETGTNGFSQTIGSLSGTGGAVQLGPNGVSTAVLTTGGDNTSTSYSGQFLGGGSLVKVGSGTFTIASTSSNGYTGGTTVSAGTLLINNAVIAGQPTNSGTGAGPVTVAAGATLGGNGTLVPNTGTAANNTVTVNGTVAPGAAANAIGTLAIGSGGTGGVPAIVNLNGTYLADLGDPIASISDRLAITGTLNLGASSALNATGITAQPGGPFTANYVLATFTARSGTFATANIPANSTLQYNATSIVLQVPVPEPAGVLAACATAAGLAGLTGRRRGARAPVGV
jgi:autotransporter-associated beta strand protein